MEFLILFVLLSLISVAAFIKKKTINALPLIVLCSYLSFLILYYSPVYGALYYQIDCVRVASVMLLILWCGIHSKAPKAYFIYALAMLVQIGFSLSKVFFGSEITLSYLGMMISIAELAVFGFGIHQTLKVKTKNDLDDLSFNFYGDSDGHRAVCGSKALREGKK